MAGLLRDLRGIRFRVGIEITNRPQYSLMIYISDLRRYVVRIVRGAIG